MIAEVGINHNGDLAIAKQLVDAAVTAGADAVKFQKRKLAGDLPGGDPRPASPRRAGPAVHRPDPGRVRAVRRTVPRAVRILSRASRSRRCARRGIAQASTSSRRATSRRTRSARPISRIFRSSSTSPRRASRCCSRRECRLKRKSGEHWRSSNSAALNTHSFTASAHIQRRRKRSTFASWNGCANGRGRPVGYSGHDTGIAISLAAVAMGARLLERHLTLDRTMRGPDHKASLEPAQFAEQVRAVREVEASLGVPHRWITRGETLNRRVLGKSLVAATDIPAHTTITRGMLTSKSPGLGLSPQFIDRLVGRRLARAIARDEMFLQSDVEDAVAAGRSDRHRRRRAVGDRRPLPRLRIARRGLRAARHAVRRVPRQRPRPRCGRRGLPRRPQAVRVRRPRARVLPRHADRSLLGRRGPARRCRSQRIQKTIDLARDLAPLFEWDRACFRTGPRS